MNNIFQNETKQSLIFINDQHCIILVSLWKNFINLTKRIKENRFFERIQIKSL